jgi:translation elongation factor EF-4
VSKIFLAAIIERIPLRKNIDEPLQALIFDSLQSVSWNRSYFRVKNGQIKKKGKKLNWPLEMNILLMK